MAISVLQQASASATSGTSPTVTISAPAAGSALVLSMIGNAGRPSAVSGGGVTWGIGKQSIFGNYACDWWLGLNSSGSGTSISITLDASTYYAIMVAELSGILTSSALDATTDADDGTSTSASTGGFTAAASPVIYLSALAVSGGATASSPTGSFTGFSVVSAGGVMRNYSAYRIDTTAAAATSGWTVSSSVQWSMAMIALRGVAGSAAATTAQLANLANLPRLGR